jgi:thiamine-phosphate pyrophosphorylase
MVDEVFNVLARNLYLCVGLRDDMATFLPAVLRGGVDVVQLREKEADVDAQRPTAHLMQSICHDFDVPFIINDSPEFALEVSADGVHVGQDDVSVAHCRKILGDEAIVGLSTHSSHEFTLALREMATYVSAGPIVPTPTKPGREGTGLDYAVASEAQSDRPVFVTGGVNADNIASLVHAGLRHFVVVRSLTQSTQPERSARQLRQALDDALSAVTIKPT